MNKFINENRGFVTWIFQTLMLYSLTYGLSLLFQGFSTENMEIGSQSYYVNPVIGIISILFVFVMVIFYSIEFQKLQIELKSTENKRKQIIGWFLYVIFVIFEVALTFLLFLFKAKGLILYSFIFESDYLNNLMFVTVLGMLTPLSYLWMVIVKKILLSFRKENERSC